jgi:hypothetical protein
MMRMRTRRPTEKVSAGLAGSARVAEALEVIAKSIVA